MLYPVVWRDDRVALIDQTRLPRELTQVEIRLVVMTWPWLLKP